MRDIRWLAKHQTEAFNALPEPYQADSCLTFFWKRGVLCAAPKDEERPILGNWICSWNGAEWKDEKGHVVS